MAGLTRALVLATDMLMNLLAGLPPLVSLTLLALVSATFIVAVAGRFSDQIRLRATKRQIQASLFEIRLFNDNPRAVYRAIRDALRHNMTYLTLSVVPLSIVSLPLLLVMVHLEPFYGYTGLRVGSSALVTVVRRSSPGRGVELATGLDAPVGLSREAGPVQLESGNEVLWRIRPDATGDFVVRIYDGAQAFEKTVHVSDGIARRSPARVVAGWRHVLYPSEAPLAATGPFVELRVDYPDRTIPVWAVSAHWSVVYVVLTFVLALAIARARRTAL